jgi:ERF superfamily
MNNYRSTELNELFSALSKAQAEMEVACKDSSNPYFKSKYANLQSIMEASRPSLCKNGLAVTQQIIPNEQGFECLVTVLGHGSGQWISSSMKINPQKSDIQSLGSYITYLRRYSYASIIGVYDGEDTDGEANMFVTEAQAKKLEKLLRDNNKLEETLKYYNIQTTAQLKQIDADKLFKRLNHTKFNQ